MKLNTLRFFAFFLLLNLLSSMSLAQQNLKGLGQVYVDYIKAELSNSYQASDSTVNELYRGKDLQPFKVGFLEMPASRLNLETSEANPQLMNTHFFVDGTDKTTVRFFIHPDSEHLYQPLINEFGYKGFYWALPTASTRTVLAWDPARPGTKPLFLKLSLAQIQDVLGRIIPGWEVRRSVRVTEMIDADLKSGRVKESNVRIIPEVGGAYVKDVEGLAYQVDRDQGKVSEHGYILRDASFIEKHRGKLVVPMFWLFSKNGNSEPPIVSMWRKSKLYVADQEKQASAFSEFLMSQFFQPFIRMNLPLMLEQGIVPQIHGQNVVIVLDPKTQKMEAIYHRDIGSMKSDYQLRWIHGLPVAPLKSLNADKDFGLSWGAEKIEDYHRDYLHDWVLRWGYLGPLRDAVHNFDPSKTRPMVLRILSKEVSRLLRQDPSDQTATQKISKYIVDSVPATLLSEAEAFSSVASSDLRLRTYVLERVRLEQSVNIPTGWMKKLSALTKGTLKEKGYLFTDYGIIYSGSFLGNQNAPLKIAFYSKDSDLQVLGYKSPVARTLRTCQQLFNFGLTP